jgi:glycosyltransferase involved in cell wall biosynthesis
MGRSFRILYAAGPGDVIGTYRHWQEGDDDPSQVSMTYSGQFYDVCRELDAQGYVIASCRTPGRVHDDRFTIVHRPIPYETGPGALYHLGQVWSALRLIGSALAFRADVAVVCNGMAHWFPLILLPLLGVEVIPSLHCVLWRKNRVPTGIARLIHRLNSPFFARAVVASMSASTDVSRQVEELTKGQHRPIVEFLPTYRVSAFEGSGEPPSSRQPFRVFFAGRIEKNKGVFDLLEVARRLAADGRTDIEFDLCGNGSALGDLRRLAEEAGLAERFRCHGHCAKAVMREMYGRAHVVIVPTTSEFIEGFNQVVAEGVLGGRPVITSDVCPALSYVREAVVEVPADDVSAYTAAILRLCDDEALYRAKCRGCAASQAQFYDLARGWAAGLKAILSPLRRVRSVDSRPRRLLHDGLARPAASGSTLASARGPNCGADHDLATSRAHRAARP